MSGTLRSVIYVPGINEKAMRKTLTLPVDAIVFDLEDSVLHDRKEEARAALAAFLQANRGAFGRARVVVRVNGRDTGFWGGDLDMAARAHPDAVLLPKVTDPEIVADARARLGAAGDPVPAIWCMVENPLGILRLERILEDAQPQGIGCLVLGTNDLVKDSDIDPGPGRANLLPWFAHVLLAAKSFGVPVVDGVLNDIHDTAALEAECAQARAMGMSGKTVIHPAQVEPVNRCFSPSAEQLAGWRRIVEAYSRPENADKGVINLDGTMVERLHLEIARRRLADYGEPGAAG